MMMMDPSSVLSPNNDINSKSRRRLGDSEDNEDSSQSSYLVDSSGNAYEPYSLAWRYLGMYIDCDIEDVDEEEQADEEEEEEEEEEEHDRKKRALGSGDGGDDENSCSRKVLWAAYHDPRYKGGSIGEYKFYDWRNDVWDSSTCQGSRCARMDCHEPRTHWKLVGVFKETDGLYDWAEQLFKHEGYCVWDGDKDNDNGSGDSSGDGDDDNNDDNDTPYESMQNQLQAWSYYLGCTQMQLSDSDGNTLYLDAIPSAEGNMTLAMFFDEDCTQQAQTSFPDYVAMWYEYYYEDEDSGAEAAAAWETRLELWNEYMTDFKVCQPCRAYNRIPTYQDEGDDEDEHRFLDEENDGQGEEEQWGYNCYDDAGYRNCNQCYKFEVKTDMEPAAVEDLQRASTQGTILRIKVDGKVYGAGGFVSGPEPITKILTALAVSTLILLVVGFVFYKKRAELTEWAIMQFARIRRLKRLRQKSSFPAGLQQAFDLPKESKDDATVVEKEEDEKSTSEQHFEVDGDTIEVSVEVEGNFQSDTFKLDSMEERHFNVDHLVYYTEKVIPQTRLKNHMKPTEVQPVV